MICDPALKPFPLRVTVNVPMLTADGASEMIEGSGFSQVTAASANIGGFPAVARMVRAVPGFATGAVNSPVAEIVPTLGLPPAVPFTVHETGPLTPWRPAVNCLVAPARTDAVAGETVTEGVALAARSTNA